jgi:hypothetical protein
VVQVLLLDGSTFTVGPRSSLVIDKFVYNPKSGKGALVASFSKGALRFVGGKLSKDEHGISVKTPAGSAGRIITGSSRPAPIRISPSSRSSTTTRPPATSPAAALRWCPCRRSSRRK